MRKLKLFITTLALLGGVISGNATDWTGNVPANGEFYLYNVGADRFLGYGANWGTRATVEHAGIPVTLASVSEGVYTITTNVVENGKCLNVNGYMDSSSSEWTFTSVAGETNTYQISSDGKHLFWDGTTVNYTTSVDVSLPSTVANSYWKLVSTADRDAAFTAMNATEAAPLDVTYKYIENPNTTYYTNIYSNANPWGGDSWKLDGYKDWQDAKDQCGERYNTNFDTYITIENIPNGEYEFGVQGFYRDGAGDAAIQNYHDNNFTPNAKIYANSNTTDMQSIAVANRTTEFNNTDSRKEINGTTYYVPNNQYMAEVYTYAGYYPWQNVRTVVTDGTLRFGVKKESTISTDWTVVDKFYISYLGPTIAAKAVALPDGDMTADTWYYFDVAIDGKYNLALTTLADIVYTTDNTILYENQNSVTDNFSNTNEVSLTAGRYYVKSASVQTLSVAAASYSYEVGTPTPSIADGSYQKSITTLTLNYADAATNDPSATFAILDNTAKAALKLAGSTVAEGTLSLDGNVLTATFSETALSLGSTYTLELAANVVGYAGQAANTAVSLTVNTPVVADGVYYMYNTYTQNYLSRSGNYATQAIMDNRGLAVFLEFDAEGKTVIKYFDNILYLGNNGFCYGDAGTGHQFTVTSVEGGYKFLCVSNNKYLAVYDGQAVNDAVEGTNLQGTSNIWALETTAQHVANYTTNANAQVATATANITALSSITTKAALETELATNYVETNVTITGSKDAKYQVYAGNSLALSEAEYYKETVEGLKPGLYKLSVDAFQRAAWYDWVYAADGARGNIYVYANDAKTQIKSVMEYGADAAYSDNWAYDGKNYPNDDASAYAALETGNYTNDVYVYVAADEGKETGTLVFGVNNPTRQGNGVNNGTWAVYNNWTLTRYVPVANITITEDATSAPAASEYANVTLNRAFNEGWNAVCLPFATPAFDDCEIAEFVGETGSGNNVTLNFNKVTAFEANKPYLVYFPSAVASGKVFEGVAVNPQEVKSEGTAFDFMGTYTVTGIAAGDYVVSGGKLSKASQAISLKPTRTYFTPKTGTTARIAGFTIGGVTTGISDIFPDEANAAEGIYNMQGQKVSGKVQKGVYIVNGKKVIK